MADDKPKVIDLGQGMVVEFPAEMDDAAINKAIQSDAGLQARRPDLFQMGPRPPLEATLKHTGAKEQAIGIAKKYGGGALPAAGMVGGALAGTATSGPVGGVVGATLGGMAGEQGRRLVQDEPTTSGPALTATGMAGVHSATAEMGGQSTGAIIGAVTPMVGRGIKAGMDKLAGVPGAIAKEESAAAVTRAGNVAKFREVEQDVQEARAATQSKNISTYREAEQHLAAKQEEVAAVNKAEREAYQVEKKAATEEQGKQDILAARKVNLAKAEEQIKPALQKNLVDTRDAVFGDLDQRWDTVRQAVGPNIKANPQAIATASNTAMAGITSVNQELYAKVVEDAFGGASPSKLSWQEAQAVYTKLGNRLAQGGLPYDVWNGLKSFQSSLGNEMETMANAAGARNDFVTVRRDYAQAMADLKDIHKSVANGASPIAHALNKADSANAAKYFEGKLTGPANRALKILARYKKYGADLNYPLRYRSILDESESLPKPKVVKQPTEPTPRPTPEMASSPYKAGPADPTSAAYQTHPVDRAAIRAEQMSKLKKRAATVGGIGLSYEIIHKLFGGTTTSGPAVP